MNKVLTALAMVFGLMFMTTPPGWSLVYGITTTTYTYPLMHQDWTSYPTTAVRGGFTFHQYVRDRSITDQADNSQIVQLTLRAEVNERYSTVGFAGVMQCWPMSSYYRVYTLNVKIVISHRSGYNWNQWVNDGYTQQGVNPNCLANDDSVWHSYTPAWVKSSLFAGGKPRIAQARVQFIVTGSYQNQDSGEITPFLFIDTILDTGTAYLTCPECT